MTTAEVYMHVDCPMMGGSQMGESLCGHPDGPEHCQPGPRYEPPSNCPLRAGPVLIQLGPEGKE